MTPVDLTYSPTRARNLVNLLLTSVCVVLALIAALPLVSVLYMVIVRGGERLSTALFTQLPPAAGMTGGGFGNALLGSLVAVLIASLLSVPFGILAGIYLAEYKPTGVLASAVRFGARMLAGLPSILAGVFAFTTVVLLTGRFSPVAGGVALAVLMLPTMILATEEALKMVGKDVREAAYGLGATKSQVTWGVVVPTAFQGILTGILLGVARAIGETAPLLFTMTFSDYWMSRDVMNPTASMAVLIYNFAKSPFENQQSIAWAASLVLVTIVLILQLTGRWLAPKPKTR
jgi:phosphate transport system permease protein